MLNPIGLGWVIESYTGNCGSKAVFFVVIEYHTSVSTGDYSNGGSDNYFMGIITLDKPYPHTIIQPTTTGMKITKLFVRGGVNFENAKLFSRKFNIMTKDESALKRSVGKADLNRLAEFKNAEIEIRDDQCFFRSSKKPISLKEAQTFTALAKTICEIF